MNKYAQLNKTFDKEMVVSLDDKDIEFPVSKISYHKIETKK